jgi:hypothetical protein
MSDFIKEFTRKNAKQFKKYKEYLLENDWTKTKPVLSKKDKTKLDKEETETKYKVLADELIDRDQESTLQYQLVKGILDRLKYFSNKAIADSTLPIYRDFIRENIITINLFIEKAEDYINSVELKMIPYSSLKSNEIAFHNKLFKEIADLQDKLSALNFADSNEAEVGITFHNDVKAPLSMHFDLVTEYPEIQDKLDAMGINFDIEPKNEMLINIPNPPKWNLKKHYWEQEKETLEFYISEFRKCRDGIYIDGEFISPWMYYHMNIFTTPYPETKTNKFTGKEETTDIIGVPPLRDNEWWVIQDSYLKAKEDKVMMFLAATRRGGKTTMIASHLAWCMTIGKRNLLCAGGSTKDLGQIKDNFIIDSQKKHPAFRTPNLISDWTEFVDYGIKKKDGKNIVLSTLKIVNLNKGGEKSSELLAGFTPSAFVLDEIMKAPFLDQLAAVKPALDQPGGKRCVGILSGTAGNEELAKDAFTVLNNPEANDILQMDFELFNSRVPEEDRTWRKRNFGTFIPAQMSAKDGLTKLDSTLADYLNKPDSKELRQIKIKVTDWKKAKEVILLDRKKKSKDLALYTKELLYHPIDPEEMFLSGKVNPFPVEELKRRKNELIETDDLGKKVTLVQDANGLITYEMNNKALAEYPHKGGFIDAPVVLYEDLPDKKPPLHLYVGGFDDYKQEEADTDSVGSFHIYKVNIGMDKWCGRIVASIAARPDPHAKLHRQIFLLMQAFNAIVFMENADDSFKQYLERKRVADMWLQESLDFKSDLAQKATNRRKFGWTPTPANIKFLKNLVIDYTKQEFEIEDEEGNTITILGAQRINDIGLIDEMIGYREGNNVDRITSFMSCLGLEYYLDINHRLPVLNRRKENQENKPKKQERTMMDRMFGNSGRTKKYF